MALNKRLHEPASLERSRDLFHRVAGRTTLALASTGALKQTDLGDRGLGIAFSLAGLARTCGAILKVSVHPAWVDECYMLGRAYLERCINAAFLAVCDDDANDDFIVHAIARRYRDEDRSLTLNKFTVTMRRDRPPGPLPAEIEAALQRFTSKKGRPKNWSDLSLEQRAFTVVEAVPEVETILALAIMGIYGRASEVLHGTFFGLTAFSTEQTQQAENESGATGEFDWSARAGELVALLVALARTNEALMRVLAAKAGSEAVTTQAEAIKAEVSEFFASFRTDSEPEVVGT